MKCAACNVDSVPLTNATADITETRHTTQGQGDTHQIVHAILEPPIELAEPAKTIRKEKETINEATNVTIGLLYQLIEELENKTVLVCSKDNAPSSSKERIAIWEEKEEQLIRTIENNVDNRQEIKMETLQESESAGRFRVIELKHDEELRSHSSQHVASISREVDLDEIQLEKCGSNSLSSLKSPHDDNAVEQILPIDDVEKRKTFGESTKKKKKRGLGSRLRKLLRAAFGRRKN